MITVTSFKVSSNERRKRQSLKDLHITPEQGTMKFSSGEELQEFEDELRQLFEGVFVFGCTVSAKINNIKQSSNPCATCDCEGCCNGAPNL